MEDPIPPELADTPDGTGAGKRSSKLELQGNDLTGPAHSQPHDVMTLGELRSGGETELTGLGRLETLVAVGTDLCAPSDPSFQDWLGGIYRLRVAWSDSVAFAYLTGGARVSVAGRRREGAAPGFRHRCEDGGYPSRSSPVLRGGEIHGRHSGRTADRGLRGGSVEIVQRRDPTRSCGRVLRWSSRSTRKERWIPVHKSDPGHGPHGGRCAGDARAPPDGDSLPLERQTPSGGRGNSRGYGGGPEGHELLWKTRTLLPIGPRSDGPRPRDDFEVRPTTFSRYSGDAIRAIGSGHYMGTMSNPGKVGQAGWRNTPDGCSSRD